jgi:hypothetical protein
VEECSALVMTVMLLYRLTSYNRLLLEMILSVKLELKNLHNVSFE